MPNLNEILQGSEERNISLALQRYTKVGKDSYKLLCESSYSEFSDKEVSKSVAQLFNNKVSVISGTIKRLPHNLLSFMVKENKRSFALKDGKLPSTMKRVTASIIADTEDNSIWEVVSNGRTKRVVLKSNENFEDVFKHNNRVCTASVANLNTDAQLGDFVSYYDPSSYSVKAGYVLEIEENPEVEGEKLFLVSDENANDTMVNEELIIDAADLTDLGKNPVALAALDSEGANDIKDYMKVLYKDTEFYENLKDLIGARRKLGTDGEYENAVVASIDDIQGVKDEIKDFIFNEAVKDLKQELQVPAQEEEEDVIEESTANADGDIDIASEEEMNDFLQKEAEAEAEEEEINDSLENEEDQPIEIESEEPDIEEVSLDEQDLEEELAEALESEEEIEDKLTDLLSEDEIQVVSESELDEGEFEDILVDDEGEK